MSEQTILTLKILPIMIIFALVIVVLMLHIASVVMVRGYGTYLNALRLLRNFKSVDFKIGYIGNVIYTHGGQVVRTDKRNYVGCFYYKDNVNFLQCSYVDELYDGIYINISEHKYKDTFNDGDFKWYSSDYRCDMLPDVIYWYYYSKAVSKIKKANMIEANDQEDYSDRVNKFIQRESREDNLELLLDGQIS